MIKLERDYYVCLGGGERPSSKWWAFMNHFMWSCLTVEMEM